jgi:MFS family permease
MIKNLPEKITNNFPALKYRNYRFYFLGQLISFTGSWLQGVAFGWLVYQLTKSPFWLGAISAVSGLPILLLSLYGGVLVDRFPRKKLLIITQSLYLVFALALGFLTITNLINLPLLIIITFLSGVVGAIDNPTTQAIVTDMIDAKDLPSAIGLNSAIFNTGRVLGPSVAGYLIGLIGMGNIFIINALSFLGILISLYFIKIEPKINNKPIKNNPVGDIKNGIIYSFSHPLISLLLFTVTTGAIFCFSQATLMPVIVEKVYAGGSQNLGTLLSATGLGALLGSLIVSSQLKKYPAKYFTAGGNFLFIASMFLFTFTHNFKMALFYLFFSGIGLTVEYSTIYAAVQRLVKEEFRGRVSSIYSLLFIGLSPLGNIIIGSIATPLEPLIAIRIFVIIASSFSLLLGLKMVKAQNKFQKYQEEHANNSEDLKISSEVKSDVIFTE